METRIRRGKSSVVGGAPLLQLLYARAHGCVVLRARWQAVGLSVGGVAVGRSDERLLVESRGGRGGRGAAARQEPEEPAREREREWLRFKESEK